MYSLKPRNPASAGPTARTRLFARRIQTHCLRNHRQRHKLRNNSLPRRIIHRRPDIQQKRNPQESPTAKHTRQTSAPPESPPKPASMFARRSVVSACQKYPPSLPPTAPAAAPADSPPSASAQSASENVVSTVISHVPAISCIHVPTAETALAIHWSRNSGILKRSKPTHRQRRLQPWPGIRSLKRRRPSSLRLQHPQKVTAKSPPQTKKERSPKKSLLSTLSF